MGLDITAYSNLTYIGHCPDLDDDEHGYDPDTYDRTHIEAYAYADFPHALTGIPDQRAKTFASGTPYLTGGCFAVTGKTETLRFRAGSYGGYNTWRSDLAARFNPYRDNGQPSPEGPFYHLIWFADNEGVLSQLVATILLGDFRTHEVAYVTAHAGDEWGEYDIERYRDWMRACELAADNGLIDFH